MHRRIEWRFGHFNVSDLVLLKAVFAAAQEINVPVVVGASKGERDFMGVRQVANLVRMLREEFEFPIFLNSDHTRTLADAAEAAKAGFDAIVFDVSALPLEENIRQTREAVQTLKNINLPFAVDSVKQVVESRLNLFNNEKMKEASI